MKVRKPTILKNQTAQDLFTDREEPRKVFWNIYENMQENESEILNFYGIGGIGKTTLLDKLQREIAKKNKENECSYNCIYHNFEVEHDTKSLLYKLSRQMMSINPKLEFPLFEAAFIRHCELAGEDTEVIIEKLNKTILDNDISVMIGMVAGVVTSFAAPLEFIVKKGVKALTKKIKDK